MGFFYDRAAYSRPRLLTEYQINAKIPSPSAPPFLPATSERAADSCRGRGEEGARRSDQTRTSTAEAARGFGPKRNPINTAADRSSATDVTPGRLLQLITTKKTAGRRRWQPRSQFLLLPLVFSQPKQRPQYKQRQNVRLWQSGGQRQPSPFPPAAAARNAHRPGLRVKSELIAHFTHFIYVNKVSYACCSRTTSSTPRKRNTLH